MGIMRKLSSDFKSTNELSCHENIEGFKRKRQRKPSNFQPPSNTWSQVIHFYGKYILYLYSNMKCRPNMNHQKGTKKSDS